MLVSIPLESGHIVIKIIAELTVKFKAGFNPLRIGSYCNLLFQVKVILLKLVSIPLESGHIVI